MDEKYEFSEYSYPNRLQMVTQLTFFWTFNEKLSESKNQLTAFKGLSKFIFVQVQTVCYWNVHVLLYKTEKNTFNSGAQKNTLYIS